jgi:hypothetical protein
MTITQTVVIPPDRRLVIDVPNEVPVGRVVLAFTPAPVKKATDQGSDTALETADEEAMSHVDALLGILSQIGGNIDIDELRTERIMAKHLKHLK